MKMREPPLCVTFYKNVLLIPTYNFMPRQDQRQLFAAGATDSLPAKRIDQQPYSRWWSALASITLHGMLLFLILFGGSGGLVGMVGAGGNALSVFEVGLVSLPSASGQNTAPEAQDMLTAPPPEQKRQPEVAIMPEDATSLRVERPLKNGQKATRAQRTEQPQILQKSAAALGTQKEDGVRHASLSGISDQSSGKSGLDTLATSGTVPGDGRPFGFSLGEVNGQPKVVKSVPVVYPVEARKKGITGQVLARFHLDETGVVSHLHIKSAEPPDIFNQNTLAALRQWRFQPASHNKKVVPVWVELPVEFELR